MSGLLTMILAGQAIRIIRELTKDSDNKSKNNDDDDD